MQILKLKNRLKQQHQTTCLLVNGPRDMEADCNNSPSGTIGVNAGHTIEGAKSRNFDRGIAVLQAHWTL